MLHIEDSLLEVDRDGTAVVVVSNTSKTSHLLKKGEEFGTVQDVSMVNLLKPNLNASSQVQIVSCAETEDTPDLATCVEDGKFTKEREQWRRQQMKSLCSVNHNLTPEESSQLLELLANHHDVFSLEEGERGETTVQI